MDGLLLEVTDVRLGARRAGACTACRKRSRQLSSVSKTPVKCVVSIDGLGLVDGAQRHALVARRGS